MLTATVQSATPAASGRGSGRRTFHVVLGGYEEITALDGTTSPQFVIDGVDIEVASGGWFGWGEQRAIHAHVAQHYPDKAVLDVWPVVQLNR
jgi:hypothetical protein